MTSVRDVTSEVQPSPTVARPAPAPSIGNRGEPRASLQLVRRCAWALVLLAVFCVAAEIATRLDDRITYGVPLLSRARSIEDLLVHDRDQWHGRPNVRYRKWSMNALGMRGPSASVAKPAGTVRVVVVGASEAFGLYESPEKEFSRQLEDSLNAAAAREGCPGVRFEVLNAALPGMSLPTIDHDVRARIRRLHPDLIFYYPTPTQYLNSESPRVPSTTPGDTIESELPASAALRPRFADRLRDQAKMLLPGIVQHYLRRRMLRAELRDQPEGWRFTTVPADRMDAFERDLRTLIGDIRKVGAVPLVATHANAFAHGRDSNLLTSWERFYPRATGDVILQFEARSRGMVRAVAADSSVAVADLATRFDRVTDASFSDFAHFTDLGSAHVAAVLQDAVLNATSRYESCGTSRHTVMRE
jgi:hypothetical protein